MLKYFKTKLFLITILIVTLITPMCFAENEVVDSANVTADTVQTPVETPEPETPTPEETDESLLNADYSEDDITSEDDVTTEDSQSTQDIHEGDLYLSDFQNEVVMDKLVNGNVYIIGNNVTIKGQIAGNLFVFAKSVKFEEAYIESSTFICADNVEFKAVTSDLYVCTNNLNIPENYGVYRDLRSFAKKTQLLGIIGRNAFCNGDSIEISDTTKFYGDFEYTAKDEISVPEGIITGKVTYNKPEDSSPSISSYIIPGVWSIIFALAIYGLCIKFAKTPMEKSEKILKNKFLQAFGIGIGFVILIPVVGIISMLSVIGLQLGFFIFALYFILLGLSMATFNISLTNLLSTKFNISNIWLKLLIVILTSLVMYIISIIPYITYLTAIPTLLGFGILIINIFFRNFNIEKNK